MKTTAFNPLGRSSRPTLVALCAAVLGFTTGPLLAQTFDVGSNGILGDVVITTSQTIDLPPDGILHYRSLQVDSGATLSFRRNARNTPVYILAQTTVVVNGTLDVSGSTANPSPNSGGVGGPGGFDGGQPGFDTEVPAGHGYGPGGGRPGTVSNCGAADGGGGAFGNAGLFNSSVYGNKSLIPLVGGSGGGGILGVTGGGGGGGGAILLAANTSIEMGGVIAANGGRGGTCNNRGSGGAIRLVSMRVVGTGTLSALGGTTQNRGFGSEGLGRIRIDTIDRTQLRFAPVSGDFSTGGNLLVLPPVVPSLTVTEVAEVVIPEGTIPATIVLPFGSSPNRRVKVLARDFGRTVNFQVAVTPDSGPQQLVSAVVDNTTINPAEIFVDIALPINTKVTLHCWTIPPPPL